MNFEKILENAFYLLAILNPASKVMFLSTYNPKLTRQQNLELSWKSSLAALLILILLAGFGEFVLMKIFRVQLYSLQLVGGFVLLLMGITAIREGRFVQQRENDLRNNFTEISLVPLAAPLIAGPGMIAAAIAGCAADGWVSTSFSIFIAILINFILHKIPEQIKSFLSICGFGSFIEFLKASFQYFEGLNQGKTGRGKQLTDNQNDQATVSNRNGVKLITSQEIIRCII